jgi:sulfide:quinone oxidoreductase
MAHIAIISAGVGGVPCAFGLRTKLGKEHRVTLIGSSPFFEFTPSNPWVAVGWRKPEQTRVEMHDPLESKGVQWLPYPVKQIDATASTLTLESGQALKYDYLVIATGPRLAFEEVPGLGPAGFTQSLCIADFGDSGAAFVALPQTPPRNLTWARQGRWVHLAKIAFEKYFLRKVRSGSLTPVYEKYVLKALGIVSLKEVHR